MSYAVARENGSLFAIAEELPAALPLGLSATSITEADAEGLRAGSLRWDATTSAAVPVPGWIDPSVLAGNRTTLETNLAQDLAAAQAIIDTAQVSATNAGVRELQRQVKDMARMNRRLIRLVLQSFDAAE